MIYDKTDNEGVKEKKTSYQKKRKMDLQSVSYLIALWSFCNGNVKTSE